MLAPFPKTPEFASCMLVVNVQHWAKSLGPKEALRAKRKEGRRQGKGRRNGGKEERNRKMLLHRIATDARAHRKLTLFFCCQDSRHYSELLRVRKRCVRVHRKPILHSENCLVYLADFTLKLLHRANVVKIDQNATIFPINA